MTKIKWTDVTINCVTGCTKFSIGCRRCYACSMTKRLVGMGNPKYQAGFDKVVVHPEELLKIDKFTTPRMIFINSMSDTFHSDIPLEFQQELFSSMAKNPQHKFQVLTKRSKILLERSQSLDFKDNVWIGVTVEHPNYLDRLDDLRKVPAEVRFVSFEPLLEAMPKINLEGIDWVIVGGESGAGSEPMAVEWARDIRDQCIRAKVPFFFKQYGGRDGRVRGDFLDGRQWHQWPVGPNTATNATPKSAKKR